MLLRGLNSQGERKKKFQSSKFNPYLCAAYRSPTEEGEYDGEDGEKCFLFYRHLKYVKV